MAGNKLKGCIGADGKIWCLPCNFTNNPPTGGSRYGWRDHPCGKGYKHHNGLDLSGRHGMDLYATKDGYIEIATYDSDCGNYIILNHQDGTKSAYLHMGTAYGEYPNKDTEQEKSQYQWLVKRGDKVKQGQVIGSMGSTGCSTGTHLHFGVQKDGYWTSYSRNYVDPMLYIGGTLMDIDLDDSTPIADNLKVNNAELSVDNNWTPITWDISNLIVSGASLLNRRRNLLNGNHNILFNKFNSEYYVIGINPKLKDSSTIKFDTSSDSFWSVAKQCGFTSKDNYAYCISRANNLISNIAKTSKKLSIPNNIKDWFEYNESNKLFEFGNLPRIGSIMCWKDNNSGNYQYYIVEQVISTHCLKISEYTGGTVKDSIIKNLSNNWGMTGNYSLKGFINVIPNSALLDDSNSSISINSEGALSLSVTNNTDSDKYMTALFLIPNMKHINNIRIKAEAYQSNSESNKNNHVFINLSQQVWNCSVIGTMSSDESEDLTLRLKWPFTYFPKNQSELTRYNAPYPTGTLTIDRLPISNSKSSTLKIDNTYNIYEYEENGNKVDTFTNLNYGGLLRNYPGFLCVTIKAPASSSESKSTSTTLIIKEISTNG